MAIVELDEDMLSAIMIVVSISVCLEDYLDIVNLLRLKQRRFALQVLCLEECELRCVNDRLV